MVEEYRNDLEIRIFFGDRSKQGEKERNLGRQQLLSNFNSLNQEIQQICGVTPVIKLGIL